MRYSSFQSDHKKLIKFLAILSAIPKRVGDFIWLPWTFMDFFSCTNKQFLTIILVFSIWEMQYLVINKSPQKTIVPREKILSDHFNAASSGDFCRGCPPKNNQQKRVKLLYLLDSFNRLRGKKNIEWKI